MKLILLSAPLAKKLISKPALTFRTLSDATHNKIDALRPMPISLLGTYLSPDKIYGVIPSFFKYGVTVFLDPYVPPSINIILYRPHSNFFSFSQENPVYTNNDEIKGEIELTPQYGSSFSYSSLSIDLTGHVKSKDDSFKFDFLHLTKEIQNDSSIDQTTKFSFLFNKPGLIYESYKGDSFSIEYFIRVTLVKKFILLQQVEDKIIYIILPHKNDSLGLLYLLKNDINAEILNRKNLGINMTLFKNKFHLKDEIAGEIVFNHIDLPIYSVEILLVKVEKMDSKLEEFIAAKHQICDGNPNTGEVFGFRIPLENYELFPSMNNFSNYKCWVKYYIRLSVVSKLDDDDYFYEDSNNDYGLDTDFEKEFTHDQEILLWRKEEEYS